MKTELVFRIYDTLQKADLSWHGWHWWKYQDKWFDNFKPEDIDDCALQMANAGMIEASPNKTGFRRKEKTLKEKIFLKLYS